jgi:hypothetical protein
MSGPKQRPPEDPGRPSPREAFHKAKAAAAPRVAKAVESAGPKVEKAANRAGKLFGTLRERAKDTAKSFSDGYANDDEREHPVVDVEPDDSPPGDTPDRRPRPGPR